MTRRNLALLVLLFNLIMTVSFIASSDSIWSQINANNSTVYINAVQISFTHPFINGTHINLGPTPTVIPNYPFLLFIMGTAVNLIFFFLVIRSKKC
jgi:hypothetical protein